LHVFAVAVSGLRPLDALDVHANGVPVTLPTAADPSFLEVAPPVLSSLQEAHGAVLVLHNLNAEATRRVAAARNLADAKSTAPLPLDLPGSALLAVAALLQDLAAAGVSAGSVLAHTDVLLRHCLIGGRTRSVTRLSVPGVRLRDHVRSWVPGTVFTVGLAPTPTVTGGRVRLGGHDSGHAWRVVTAGDPALGDGLLPDAAAGPDAPRPVHVDDHDVRSWWKARKAAEVAAVPVDVAPVAADLTARNDGRCRVCGDSLRDATCPFCSALEVL
jgi:hypothetical protein